MQKQIFQDLFLWYRQHPIREKMFKEQAAQTTQKEKEKALGKKNISLEKKQGKRTIELTKKRNW